MYKYRLVVYTHVTVCQVEIGGRFSEDRRRKTEDGRRKTEDGRRKTEGRRQRAEDKKSSPIEEKGSGMYPEDELPKPCHSWDVSSIS